MNTKTGTYESWKWSLSLVALAFFSLVEPAHAQVLPPEADNIVTVAGTHLEIGDGGPATSALFLSCAAIVFDSAGNGYIPDGNGHRIRKVVPGPDGVLDGLADPDPAEIITTFAGLGGSGFNGDNIPATTAQLNFPRCAVFDLSRDNLYVAENGGHRIRRINMATGIITTVAGTGVVGSTGDGGPATAAQINSPGFVAFDSSGNLYITEVFGFLVRKIVPGANGIIDGAADEIITTVAGNGTQCPVSTNPCGDGGAATAAQLNQANGISVDAAGNLYIADNLNGRIRKVTRSPDPPLGDGNVDGDMDEIITTVAGNGASCPGSTNPCGDGGPATSAMLSNRTATIDSSGNLYIADFANRRVRFVNLGTAAITLLGQTVLPGNITTIAGTGVVGSTGDGGLATAARLNGPNNVSFDSAGDIYIAEALGQRVRKVNRVTGIITTVAGGGIFDPHDGGPATAAQFNPAGNVAFDPSGNFYIADFANNRIRKVDRVTGIITTVAGTGPTGSAGNGLPATAAQLNGPSAIAFDSGGNLFIADATGRRIRRIVPGSDGVINGAADEIITLVAGNLGAGPVGDGGPANAAVISDPRGLVFDSAGNLYVSELNGDRIRKIVPGSDGVIDGAADEIITTIAGTGATGGLIGDDGPATAAQVANPFGMAFDSAGNFYIADSGNNRIRKVIPGVNGVIDGAADEIITTIVNQTLGTGGFNGDGGPATAAQINSPQDVAVDSSGNLYIADVGNNRVRFVNLGTTTTSISGQTVLAGHITTLVNQTPGTVGFSGDGDLAIAAQLNGPRGVSFDSAGNLHINDSANSRIRRLNVATPATVTPKELDPADPTGNWVRATIQLPADWNASDVDIDTVMLEAINPTDGAVRNMSGQELKVARDPGAPVTTQTHALMLRFHRGTVLSWANGDTLKLRVEGQFRVPDPGEPGQFLEIGRYFSGETSVDIVQ